MPAVLSEANRFLQNLAESGDLKDDTARSHLRIYEYVAGRRSAQQYRPGNVA
jgi:hypothetical protein